MVHELVLPENKIRLAYFSMEFGLHSDVPTYAGGLGMLAGDILRSCADLKIPTVGLSIAWTQGFTNQTIHADGTQDFTMTHWYKKDYLKKLPNKIKVKIEDRDVTVGVWQYDVVGKDGYIVPVYLLDTDLDENEPWDRDITKQLYTSEWYFRLCQEVVLGIGGVRMLRNLGYTNIETFHLNEGHTAFTGLELLKEMGGDIDCVKDYCVFTTHTPVPAGHDRFDYKLVDQVMGKSGLLPENIKQLGGEDKLNMTQLALNISHAANAVSQKHEQVSNALFPGYKIKGITNGVHHLTWTSEIFKNLYDHFIPEWSDDPTYLIKALTEIPDEEILKAHNENKRFLIQFINHYIKKGTFLQKEIFTGLFKEDVLTIVFARRAVPYKRPLLIYKDLERLCKIGNHKIQIIHAGKCGPEDEFCLNSVENIIDIDKRSGDALKIVYVDNYNIELAQILCSGADIWLNCPERPLEASGTSGMKACLNGGLNLSVLDGWWIEAMKHDLLSGFAFGGDPIEGIGNDYTGKFDDEDANDLYKVLEEKILPAYYENKSLWIEMMKHSIALGSYFNTHRCVKDYEDMW